MIKLACMTLPYIRYSFERSLTGISAAGYRYVALGLPHEGKEVPDERNLQAVAELQRLFDRYGLEPVVLVSTNQLAPGQPLERARARFETAKSLGITELLSLGVSSYTAFPTKQVPEAELQEQYRAFRDKMREVASLAEHYGIPVSLKPHTGNTATSSVLLETLGEIGSDWIRASYDPGNVRFYEGIDPADDLAGVLHRTTSFIAKDHAGERAELNFPIPGEGQVDFPRMFRQLKEGGFAGPVVVERLDGTNSAPMTAEQLDERVLHARLRLETMLGQAGLLPPA